MNSQESSSLDNARDNGEQPDARVIDKPRVLAHLLQQLDELEKQTEADDGDA
jgi:hypothetical protein